MFAGKVAKDGGRRRYSISGGKTSIRTIQEVIAPVTSNMPLLTDTIATRHGPSATTRKYAKENIYTCRTWRTVQYVYEIGIIRVIKPIAIIRENGSAHL